MTGADTLRQSRKSRLAAIVARTSREALPLTPGRPAAPARGTRRQADEPSNAKPFQPGNKEDGLHAVPPDIASDVGKDNGLDLGQQLDPKKAYSRLKDRIRRADGMDPPPPATGEERGEADAQVAEAEAKKRGESMRTHALAEAKKHGFGEAEAGRHADASAKRHGDAYAEARKAGKKHAEAMKHADGVAMAYHKAYAEARKAGTDEEEAKKAAEGAAAKHHADMMPPKPAGDPPPQFGEGEGAAEADMVDDAEAEERAEAEELARAMDEVMGEETAEEQAGGELPPQFAGELPPQFGEETAEDNAEAEDTATAGDDGVPPEEKREDAKDAEWMEMMTEGEVAARQGSFPIHLYLVGGLLADNPHYVVLVDGHAYGEIAYADQPGEKTAEFKKMFCEAEAYADTIEKCVRKYGIKKTMTMAHGRVYAAKVSKSKLAKQLRAEILAELEGKHREKLATVKDQFADWFAVALEAYNKGVLTRGEGHAIKEELVKQLSAARIHPQKAIEMIEASFRSGGRRFSTVVAARAAEWMAAPREHQASVIAEVRGADHHVPVVASAEQIASDNVRELAMGSLPITSLGAAGVTPRDQAERYAALDPGMADLAVRGKQAVRGLLRRG